MSVQGCSSWIRREIHGYLPSPRQGHAVTVVNKVGYVFGGSSTGISNIDQPNSDIDSVATVYFNDLYTLKVASQVTWDRIHHHGDIPCARDGHTLNALGSMLYLFGGANHPDAKECLQGLYSFDTVSLLWEKCPTQGRQPYALGHTTAVVGSTLYIFGGIFNGEATNNLYMLNTGNLTWTPLSASGRPPKPRCDHSCTVVGDQFYIFGGNGGEDLWFNDLHCFDTVTLTWIQVEVYGNSPYPRCLHTITAHHDKDIYLFGGSNDSLPGKSPFSDLYRLNLSSKKWKKLHPPGVGPEKRFGHTAFLVYGQLIVFGGMNDQREFNDVCILQTRAAAKQLPPEMQGIATGITNGVHFPGAQQPIDIAGPQLSYSLSQPAPSPYKHVIPAGVSSVKPRDLSDLRSSVQEKLDAIFDDLTNRYAQLDTESQVLEKAVEAFQDEKRAHFEQYERQQKELEEMRKLHKKQTEEWLNEKKEELEKEWRELRESKEVFKQEKEALVASSKHAEAFKRIDAILSEVKLST